MPTRASTYLSGSGWALHVVPTLDDNYAYLLAVGSHAWVVDPGEAEPVLDLVDRLHVRVENILVTHGHHDHIGGIPDLKAAYRCPVTGPTGVPGISHRVGEGDLLEGDGFTMHVLATPGHTLNHLSFVDSSHRLLFCGDIIFGGGCGRIMGSTAAELFASLARLASLPADLQVCCGHEYTLDNLRFARSVDPGNTALLERLRADTARVAAGQPTMPSTLQLEKATNPFLRVGEPAIRKALAMLGAPEVEIFRELRQRKDVFA